MRSGSSSIAPLPPVPGLADPVALSQDGTFRRYAARRMTDGNLPVVVTVLQRSAAAHTIRARLRDQSAELMALHHPQVAPLLALDLEADEPWVLHARTAGVTLLERLEEGPVPLATALAWGVELCRGLEAIATIGLAHLGLDALSVKVDGDTVSITGLGLAPPAPQEPLRPDHACLAPEQLLGLPADIRADLHAVGVLLFRALTGAWPVAIHQRADLDAWARGEIPEERLAGLAAGPASVLRRCLARRVADRYPGPGPLREDLERLCHGFSPLHARPTTTRTLRAPGTATVDHLRRPPISRSSTPMPAVITAPPKRSRMRVSMLVGGLALVGLAAAGVVMTVGRSTETKPQDPTPLTPAPSRIAPWALADGQDQHGPWAEVLVSKQTLRFRKIPASRSWIGSPVDEPGRQGNESRFLAHLSRPVWMLDREVAQGFYQAVCGANPSHFRGQDLPVENLTWDDAREFCARLEVALPALKVRLPTEVEWEMAARSGTNGPFAVPTFWDAARSGRVTQPVATQPPNAWGFHDLHGNVLEWTADAMAPYPTSEITDRQVTSGAQRVARGGAWCSEPNDCRSASRSAFMAKAHLPYLGFRVVVEER